MQVSAYNQVGSQLQAPAGDITVNAQSIAIGAARELATQDQETRFRQSGLTVSLSAPGLSAAQGAISAASNASRAEDSRFQALAAATAVSKAMEATKQIKDFAQASEDAQKQSISLSLTVGSSQSQTSQHNQRDQAAGSALIAGKTLSLNASGAGAASNLSVSGSQLAGQDVRLKADNAVTLQAAGNTSEQHSKDSSSSAAIGVAVSLGKQTSFGITASLLRPPRTASCPPLQA